MAADQERADRIKALKQARPDLTWRRIGDYVGVSERAATDWQKKGGIEYDNAKKLAELFEVDVDYIWRGPSEADRAPSPFAGQDALADRFDQLQRQVTDQLTKHAEAVEGLLKRQDEVLDRIEKAIAASEAAREQLRQEGQAWAERAVALGLQEFARAPETQEVVPGTPGASE